MTTNALTSQQLPWHEAQRRQWQQQRRLDKIPHAVLLAGPAGLGKRQFAHYLAQTLVCTTTTGQAPCGQCRACRLMDTGSHPDSHAIAPEDTFIKVDAIRALIHKTNLTAEHWQVFLIDQAEAMHPSAANALLKTLEEPAPNTMLVLSSAEPQQLPATIRSRCQIITFHPVATTEAIQWLADQQPGISWEPVLALAGGAPLLAIQLLATKRLEQIQQRVDYLSKLRLGQEQPMPVVKALAEQPLSQVLDDMLYICYDIAYLAAQAEAAQTKQRLYLPTEVVKLTALMQHIHQVKLHHFIAQLHTYKAQQPNNLNPVMVIEKMLACWEALTNNA